MPIPKLIATAVMMAANMAMAAMQKVEGPRLTDTRATVADYGTPSNSLAGTQLVPAHCVFAKDILEKKKKRKGKGGKQVSYTGYGTFMVQVAEHPCTAIRKIYMDNHLVYDNTGSGEKIFALAADYDFEAHMRFMLGAPDQECDPDMLAFIEARDGPGTCPAYRDQTNIYFEKIPLENFGNRLPDVKVLAEAGGASSATENWITEFKVTLPDPLPTIGAADVANVGNWNLHIELEVAGGNADGIGYGPQWIALYYRSDTDELVADDYVGGPDPTVTKIGDWFYIVWPDYLPTEPSDPIVVSFNYAGGVATVRSWFGLLTTNRTFVELQGRESSVGGGDTLEMTVTEADYGGAPFALDYGFAPTGRSSFTSGGVDYVTRNDTWANTPITDYELQFLPLGGGGEAVTLATLLTRVALRGGASADDLDFAQVDTPTYAIDGYKWTQGTGDQICAHLCDLFDVDLRPHDFTLQALPRGSGSIGEIVTGELVADSGEGGGFDKLIPTADEDLPRRVFLSYADRLSGYEPNVAMPVGGPDRGASGSQGEITLDASTLVLDPDRAQQLVERRQRRTRFGRTSAEFSLTRRRIAIEPGDVFTPILEGHEQTMRCTKLTIGADGVLASEWERDDPRIANLPGSEGAIAAGYVPDAVPETVDSVGGVMDLPLLVDAHEQSAPFAYIAAGPSEPGPWMGADVATSDTGELDSYLEGWDGVASGDGAVIGTCVTALPAALPWVLDGGSVVTVDVNAGQMTAATLEDLLADPTRNLAAVSSTVDGAQGWELVQFMTPSLVADHRYAITGLLRGMRGTEWAIGGHGAGDRFVLLDGTAKRHTLGAAEIGDTDWYAFTSIGQALDQDEAEALGYSGASHKPYAPIDGSVEQDGADWVFDAVRRTRIGGATLNGQDVPLGESAESWSFDIMDGDAVKRTLTSASLPIRYLEADQVADWGGALTESPAANLYQVDPTLSLRGYPFHFPEGDA